jgi:5-methyltetrahydrofolate--homocysteine methyltransferase
MSENILKELDALIRERIVIHDGAMGSMLKGHKLSDLLCLSNPELITAVHDAYLEAGADIISTCSFNANAISLAEYGMADEAYEISRAAGAIARQSADKFSASGKRRFAAGSMGPMTKSASIASDLSDPGKRSISWDELEAAYYDNARGLLDGGVDILLLETIFDTLNAKAAIAAVIRLREERKARIPLIISATVSGAGGRLLSGQTIEAFAVSVSHAEPIALGLNCSFGAEKLLPHLAKLSAFSRFPVICYPNAGLPDSSGTYSDGPEEMSGFMKTFFEQRLVNIAGGCCGTTPAHIAAIAELAKNYSPRPLPEKPKISYLSGLEVLPLPERGSAEFINIGERTNVAGSRKFLKLIQNSDWDEAVNVAEETLSAGARVIDVCMDNALLDGKAAMVQFLNNVLFNPEIARFPVMPDSSSWDVLEAALKCIQGKPLVNSISLKEGEAEFLRRAALICRYGAAVMVMLIDEEGQAMSYERKIQIAERSYKLLTGTGFPPEDIVFDPNVLTIATGIAEHDSYALDFIRACSWIVDNCPGVHVSAGVSNLSFSFRGNNEIRSALHTVFLNHAVKAGLSMAILNPADFIPMDRLRKELREAAEDAVLCRNGNGGINAGGNYADRLLEVCNKEIAGDKEEDQKKKDEWRNLPIEDKISYAMVKGIDRHIAEDTLELHNSGKSYIEIVEGPLMRGIEEIGRLYGAGSIFLHQMIRSAQVMKKALATLDSCAASGKGITRAGKIVLATVRGDVHDIGKNIVAVILGCNAYEVIDLGVMVSAEKILETARNTGADCIGLSGLISSSLDEMVFVAEEMEKAGFTIPLLIGGAAASAAHTALRIARAYSGPVVYLPDAGRTPQALASLLSPVLKSDFLRKLNAEHEEARRSHEAIAGKSLLLTLEEARANRLHVDWNAAEIPVPKAKGIIQFDTYLKEKVIERLDWEAFCRSWELRERGGNGQEQYNQAKRELVDEARALLEEIKERLSLRAVLGFFPAHSDNEDIVLYDGQTAGSNEPAKGLARFCFLRNQVKKTANATNLCLSDYILPVDCARDSKGILRYDWLGLFALTADFKNEKPQGADRLLDDSKALLAATLADSLAEAFSVELSCKVKEEFWPVSLVPAFGYPSCPDHYDKKTAIILLEAERRIGLSLSESAMIIPASSVCGMYFAFPDAKYFAAGEIGADQLALWAKKKGITEEQARRHTGRI